MTGPRAAPGAGAACTRTALTRSTLVTAGQGTAWPRSGLSTQMPFSSATIRGHQAHPYTTPVTATTRNAVTTEEWPRPLTARATRLITANTSHAHHSTTDPGDRNTCRWLEESCSEVAAGHSRISAHVDSHQQWPTVTARCAKACSADAPTRLTRAQPQIPRGESGSAYP